MEKPKILNDDWEYGINGEKIGRSNPMFVKGYNTASNRWQKWIVERLEKIRPRMTAYNDNGSTDLARGKEIGRYDACWGLNRAIDQLIKEIKE